MKYSCQWIVASAADGVRRAVVAAGLAVPSARAGTIIDEWNKVKVPPPPNLQSVTVDTKDHRAADAGFRACELQRKARPRCVASLPAMKKLLGEARAQSYAGRLQHGRQNTKGHLGPSRANGRRTLGAFPRRQVPAHRPGQDPQEQRHQDRDHGRHCGAWRSTLYCQRRGVPGLPCIVPVDGSARRTSTSSSRRLQSGARARASPSNITLTTSDMIKF